MNPSNFKRNIEESKNILSMTPLLKSYAYMHKPIKTKFNRIKSRDDLVTSYLDEIDNLNYTFLLSDDSFFQFQCTLDKNSKLSLRYCYFQFPYDIFEYKKFIKEEYGYDYADVGDSKENEYFLSAINAPIKESILYLRYDYAENGYVNGIHGASHIHIGFLNSIRLTVDKLLTPEAFLFFILKQVYSETWSEMIKHHHFKRKYSKFKENCSELCESLFSRDLDKYELYMT
ncbi:DUF2290 domain-containing protein [Methanolobus sp. WCC1]|uniref:DUF2290 domain-containing protein n=1 Tax=unclassified Methanolobus TaxID=2629569 RepID=UPI00324BC256